MSKHRSRDLYVNRRHLWVTNFAAFALALTLVYWLSNR